MRALLAFLALFALPAVASTPTYTAAAGSTLGFGASYDGEAFTGRFDRFSADIAFDPATAAGRFDVVIELGSAGTDNDERDETLLGAEFFDAARTPQARYVATRFRKLDDGRFVAEGVLTLRGIAKAVPLTFTWTAGAMPVLAGSATVPRLAFNVGTGDWADTAVLPDAVSVTTRLVLQPTR